jgi:hypothetical protein
MEKNPAIKYFESLEISELHQIAEDLQKAALEDNSPLRKAAKEIFGEDSALTRVGVAVPLSVVLSDMLSAAEDALSTYTGRR